MSATGDKKTTQILLVANNDRRREWMASLFSDDMDCALHHCSDMNSARELAGTTPVDLVLAESEDSEGTGAALPEESSARSRLVLFSPEHDRVKEDDNVVALPADCEKRQARRIVHQLLELRRLHDEVTLLRQNIAMSYGFDNIVGISQPILKAKEALQNLAPTDITVLILGGPGTGKELIARTVHHHSQRRKGPFVLIDCSAIPEVQMGTEIFGSDRPGLLEQAHGGSVFIDHLEAMPPSLQTRFADFMRDFRLRKPGGEPGRKVSVRVLAAAPPDLERAAHEDRFDRNLYNRLNVIPIHLPELSRRTEDIEILIDYFLGRIAFEMHRSRLDITRAAVDRLLRHSWPGNVRELENCLRRAVALCTGSRLDLADISFVSSDRSVGPETDAADVRGGTGRLDETQRTIIARALDENNWNFTQTAQHLGIGRTTLWRKVKKYKLKRQPEGQGA